MRLNLLQHRLEALYDVSTAHRVEDFVLHDAALAQDLASSPRASQAPETLLVAQAEGCLELSLFLDSAMLDRLTRDSPMDALHDGNLADFLTALEGVSHFLYLVWCAERERRVTALEMELQAEVDKFVTAAALFRQQTGDALLSPLRRALFEQVGFRPDLGPELQQRYYEANRLAGRYCRVLERRYERAPAAPELVRELRRFYRMPKQDKIRYIENFDAR
jgi:hypothetical protein